MPRFDYPSFIKVTPFFVADADDESEFIVIHRMLGHLADQKGDLSILLRGLVPFRMGLLDDADEDAQIGIAFLRRFDLGNGVCKKLRIPANLSIYYFSIVIHTTRRARPSAAQL